MSEKKHIIKDLRLTYSGPLSVEEFYAEIHKWMNEWDLNEDLKRKSEEVMHKGKKVEWITEGWKEVVHDVRHVVRLRALFDNVTDSIIKKRGKKIRISQAEVMIEIDGFVETHLEYHWSQKPSYQFLRTLFDKYIWPIGMTETERNEGPVRDECYDLHSRIKAFFNLYKMKVG